MAGGMALPDGGRIVVDGGLNVVDPHHHACEVPPPRARKSHAPRDSARHLDGSFLNIDECILGAEPPTPSDGGTETLFLDCGRPFPSPARCLAAVISRRRKLLDSLGFISLSDLAPRAWHLHLIRRQGRGAPLAGCPRR